MPQRRRRYRPRVYLRGRLGCIGCSLPLLAAVAVVVAFALPFLTAVPAHVLNALGNLGELLAAAGGSLVTGLIGGLTRPF